MKRLIWLLFLIQSDFVAVAQTDQQPKLVGLVDALGKKFAIIHAQMPGVGPRGDVILTEGQVEGALKVLKIDSASGTANAVVAGKTCTLKLNEPDGPTSADKTEHLIAPYINLVSVNLDTAISLYADFKSRTVLQHPQLEDGPVSIKCNPHTSAEATEAFEKMFDERKIATIPDGDKFVMIVPFAVTNTVTPCADTIAATNAPLQALSVNFRSAPLQMVVQTYSDFLGKKIVNPGDVPRFPGVTFVQTTPLSKAQILYAWETQMAWRNFRLVPDDSGNLRCERIQ
jgi:hypothetical protein